jgi:Cu/Ag efflux pump CusA
MAEVTAPLEQVSSSLPDVQLVRSITSRGSSEISINLDWRANVEETLQMLQGRIEGIKNALPPTAEIQVQQMRVSVFPIQGYSLISDHRSLAELRDIALFTIRPVLLQIKGVARIEVTGGDVQEYRVTIDPVNACRPGPGHYASHRRDSPE